jgi:hypothetical protein
MDDEKIDPCFLVDMEKSREVTHARQNIRQAKEGEVTLSATIQCFLHEGDNFKSVERAVPPPLVMKQKRAGVGSYPASIALYASVDHMAVVPGQVEARVDGKPGWRVLEKINYFDTCSTWLRANNVKAYALADREQDPLLLSAREYITPDGILQTHRWRNVSPGDRVKIKVSGKAEDNVFRRKNPNNDDMYLVQPTTQCRFLNLIAETYINLKEESAVAATAAANDTTTTSAAGGDGETGGPPLAARRFFLLSSPSFNCKGGAVISEDYDPNMAQTERYHQIKDANAHNMVPVSELRLNASKAPKSAYFYVKAFRQTRWAPPPSAQAEGGLNGGGASAGAADTRGVTIIRDQRDMGEPRDYVHEYQGVVKHNVVVRFNVYQWAGRPNSNEKYVVMCRANKDKAESLWRAYGITSGEAYAMIIGVHPDLPLHLEADLGYKQTIEHESNNPATINDKPEVANVRGYYTYWISNLVPDFLRYFTTAGIRLSPEYVAQEFSYWESENRATKTKRVVLKPLDPTKMNPLNEMKLSSTVLALGNGYFAAVNDPHPEYGKYHAYDGNIAPILFDGKHDFYVLTSFMPATDEQRIAHGARFGQVSDDYLNKLKADNPGLFYWIYAVRKDAKMAKNFHAAPAAAATPSVDGGGVKRERDADSDTTAALLSQKQRI